MTADEIKQIKDLIDERATRTERHVDTTAAETKSHFDEKAAETQRHFDVVGERLRADIQIIVEGHVMLNEKMDRMRDDLQNEQREVSRSVDHLASEFAEFRTETRTNFEEIRSAIRFSYAEVDRRVSILESDLASLSHRVARVEALVAH